MEKKNTHLMYGSLTGLAYIIISVVLYLVGLAFESWAVIVIYGIFLAGILLNAMAFSKANGHYVSFGNVFSSGFKASAIIALILLAWYFLSTWVFPEMREEGIERVREKMAENSKLTDEQIDANLKIASSTLVNVMGVVFGTMFFGLIFSLLGAAVAKKKGNTPPPQVL